MNSPLPPDYAWLATIKTPEILVQAVRLYGTRETPGPNNSATIMAWAKEALDKKGGAQDWYDADAKAWCGLFLAVCAKRAGYKPPDGFDALRAKSWSQWGSPISGQPGRGDVLIFDREGGGHVGLYVAENKAHFYVLGGNQSDMVNIMKIDKARLITARRSPGIASVPQIIMNTAGAISQNEA